MISPVLANVYLHYVLDLWFEKAVKRAAEGKHTWYGTPTISSAAFEREGEARAFLQVLKQRLEKFGLELAEDKTRIIAFGRKGRKRDGANRTPSTFSDSRTTAEPAEAASFG